MTAAFAPKELAMNAEILPKAAVSAAPGGSDPVKEGIWCFDRFELDLDRGEFRSAGNTISLRPKTFALLRHLVAHPARLVSRDELLGAVWPDVVVTEDSVTQCVGDLRSAMGDRAQALLKTVPKRGYILDAPVSRRAQITQPVEPEPRAGARSAPGQPARSGRSWFVAVALVIAALSVGLAASWWPAQPVHVDSGVAARRTVAILPFTDLSEPPSPAFSEAVAEDLIASVSKLSNTLVLALDSTGGFTGKNANVRAAGRELGATHVLTGSVQRRGEITLIRAQLQRSDSGAVLWSERFEYVGAAQWNWQQDITQRIANALDDRLYGEFQARKSYATLKPGAIDATLQGVYLLRRARSHEDVLRVRALFESALAADPNSSTALAGLGFTHLADINMRWSTERERQTELASQAMERAIALRPDFAAAYYGRSQISYIRGRIDDAALACEQALKLWPNQPMCLRRLGFLRLEQGRPDEVEPLINLAMRLDPLNALQISYGHLYIGMARFHRHEDDRAYEEMQKAVAAIPQNGFGWHWMAAIDALHGRDEQAKANLARYEQIIPGHTIGSLRATEVSTNPQFWVERNRFYAGLRKAGMHE
ncbi:winged helix-turn-helix domain-containing protein [Variovorax ureilyticus]|uniref:Winged helix-turn-helix domain-containing protein n=1 Tax=Variovorax ureilyticus TaxID=1836198 RepID=A0ABU8VSN6_9BURK